MHIDVSYSLRCGMHGCHSVDTQVYVLLDGAVPPRPIPPVGWVMLGWLLVCPKHEVQVFVDSQEMLVDMAVPF